LTVGHGRNAVLGDTIANLIEWTGYDVTREYYFNDGGRPTRALGESVRARLQAIADREPRTRQLKVGRHERDTAPASAPDDGYLGEYIIAIARDLYERHGTELLGVEEVAPFTDAAKKAIFAEIERTMGRLGIRMDSYFNENSLYEDRRVWTTLDRLRESGFVYDKDGAVWFKTTAF